MPRSPFRLGCLDLSYTIAGVLETHKNKYNSMKDRRKGTLKTMVFPSFWTLGRGSFDSVSTAMQPSLPASPIHVREQVVARFDLAQPFLVHPRGGELVVQRDETEQMVLHAAARVVGTRARA